MLDTISAFLSAPRRAAVLAVCLWLPGLLQAQVVQTSFGVFQAVNKEVKVVTSNTEPFGIFVLLTSPIELQLFNLATVSNEQSVHAFVKYSPELDRYVALNLGATEYRIKGSFTLWLEHDKTRVRLTVDNTNPYMSLLIDSDSKENPASLLGWRGIEPVVNQTGVEHVALLEANQLSQYRGIIEPYYLKPDGLWLKGQKVDTPSIGVEVEPVKNQCLKPNAVFLDQKDLTEIRRLKREEGLSKLGALLNAYPPSDPFKGMLLLSIKPSEIIGLHYASGVVKIIRPLTALSKEQKTAVCSVQVVELQ